MAWMRENVSRRERNLLLAAMLLAVAIRIVYVVATRGHALAGDELEYDVEGRLAVAGHWFWSTAITGVPHPSFWKAPIYGVWVGVLYDLLGAHPDRVFAVQALLSPITVGLSWLLGRRLFSPTVGLVAAFAVAVYPNVWQFDVRLFSESLATPLTLLVLLLVLERRPAGTRAAGVGALMGIALLLRPASLFLFAAIAVTWWAAGGPRRGTAMLALTAVVAGLVVLPWTLRNHHVDPSGWVPLSVQSAAAYGTFNEVSANDPKAPYAWRVHNPRDNGLFTRRPPLTEARLHAALSHNAREYILDHPASVPQAFFWNGITRLWDLRRPSHVLAEVAFTGRTRSVAAVGLAMYWILLPLALLGLWRIRRRRGLTLAIVALAFAASVVYTSDGSTRYRAPIEPLIVVLAASAAVPLASSVRERAQRRRRAMVDAPGPTPALES